MNLVSRPDIGCELDVLQVRKILEVHGTRVKNITDLRLWHERPKSVVYRFQATTNGQSRFFMKMYRTSNSVQNAAREFSALENLSRVFEPHDELCVIEPIELIEDFNAFVSREFPGENLYSFFKRAARHFPGSRPKLCPIAVAERLLNWIKIAQGAETKGLSIQYSSSLLASNAHQYLDTAISKRMIPEDVSKSVRAALDFLSEDFCLWDRRIVVSNGDTKLWNFLMSERGHIAGLDFVKLSAGLPAMDVARLWAGMNWLKVFPQTSNSRIEEIQSAFVDAALLGGTYDQKQLDFCRLCVLTEQAAFYAGNRSDRYRRKLRNVAFFSLIRRYFRKSLFLISREIIR